MDMHSESILLIKKRIMPYGLHIDVMKWRLVMPECRCDKINEIESQLTSLKEMKESLDTAKITYKNLKDDLFDVSETSVIMYSSSNIVDVKNKIRNLKEDWGRVIENIDGKIQDKKEHLEETLDDYKKEDKEFHESEDSEEC